nr:sugar ABC transporter ATP-binding protein [Iocasia fonsfrigidae]
MLSLENILEMRNINKSFYGVQALKNVNLNVHKGEVHILIGENGAGKSTLMKILSGAYQKDTGEIIFAGEKLDILSPLDAQEKGISIIYQEFNLIPGLSVAENIYLGREALNNGLIDWDTLYNNTQNILNKLKADINPKTLVKKLSVAEQQFVEIAKALSFGAKLLIMDEPSATLTPRELKRLFAVIRDLKAQGVSIIYISHHLDELFEIGDSVTVLRDGQWIVSDDINKMNKNKIIKLMVGRELTDSYPPRNVTPGEVVLEVKNLSRKGVVDDISFELRKGEILGIAGLVGSGRTELVRLLYGADPKDSGEIILNGNKININSPRDSISTGIGLLPEDRKQQGLVLEQSVKNNITLANLSRLVDKMLINSNQEMREVNNYIDELGIKTPSSTILTQNLSGGNQQKVVLAKWLFTDSDILIFDEPTRGIDVGAKYEIYLLMNQLTEQGKSIIMISSELPEIIGISDRVIVLHQGRITGEYNKKEFNQEKIMKSAAGEVS